jgi:heme-degrading monooxygenase HmoA
MYARSTILRGNPEAIDEGMAYVRDEVMPMVRGTGDGYIGLSMLADRDSGRCIVTTAWRDEAAMQASAEAVRASRARAAEIFGGGEPEVREWEIAMMHRVHETHDGARTRVIWGHTEQGQTDRMLDEFRMTMLPQIEELPGFCSLNLMVDRQSGRTALAVAYESADAMERANERAAALRARSGETISMQIDEVAEFDLLLAHLRVPEMA